jgi:hypothetical protein
MMSDAEFGRGVEFLKNTRFSARRIDHWLTPESISGENFETKPLPLRGLAGIASLPEVHRRQ